jgi:ATP-dependent DNA ligase
MWPQQQGAASRLPGIFDETIFSPKRTTTVSRSVFIKAMHPKTEISPTLASVEKILKAGWAGQVKVHGHRAQIHLCADESEEPIAYNRMGKPHKKLLPDEIVAELRRILRPEIGWTVVDAEWLKPEGKLFIFDVLKLNGKILRGVSYEERWKRLPRLYISRHVQTLPLLTSADKCMEVLASTDENVEGLVFKALQSKGFEDTSIVRCRKRSAKP